MKVSSLFVICLFSGMGAFLFFAIPEIIGIFFFNVESNHANMISGLTFLSIGWLLGLTVLVLALYKHFNLDSLLESDLKEVGKN